VYSIVLLVLYKYHDGGKGVNVLYTVCTCTCTCTRVLEYSTPGKYPLRTIRDIICNDTTGVKKNVVLRERRQ
jgi:hypothetical protein